ncbi:beta-ketoacyl-ACP synthase III [Caldicellulosiruptoraceae bacterium PP1]
MKEVKIISTGSYVPENIIDNNFLSNIVETSDEWITSRTGIKQRRISKDENTSDIAYKAALKAIEKANIDVLDIENIIVATITPDSFSPSVSCIVQEKLGAKNASCFDVNAACTGLIYGISIAWALIKSGLYKNSLVIGAEVLSKIIDWKDRNTCVLFGDGASAVFLSASEQKGIISTFIMSDGQKGNAIKIPALPVENIITGFVEKPQCKISMDGREVYRFATDVMAKSIEKVLENSGLNIEDISLIIPHQANIRIIEYAADKLKVSKDKFYINIDKYGNTSAASIGIALDEAFDEGRIKSGDNIILVGFGGGLTWGATLIKV